MSAQKSKKDNAALVKNALEQGLNGVKSASDLLARAGEMILQKVTVPGVAGMAVVYSLYTIAYEVYMFTQFDGYAATLLQKLAPLALFGVGIWAARRGQKTKQSAVVETVSAETVEAKA